MTKTNMQAKLISVPFPSHHVRVAKGKSVYGFMVWAHHQDCGYGTAKNVLMTLAMFSNQKGLVANRTRKEIAEACCISPRAAYDAIKSLCKQGHIERCRVQDEDTGRWCPDLYILGGSRRFNEGEQPIDVKGSYDEMRVWSDEELLSAGFGKNKVHTFGGTGK